MTRQPAPHHARTPFAILALLLGLIAIAGVVAGCGLFRGELTGRTWQLTSITETVPAFQGVIPAAEAARLELGEVGDVTGASTVIGGRVGGLPERVRDDERDGQVRGAAGRGDRGVIRGSGLQRHVSAPFRHA